MLQTSFFIFIRDNFADWIILLIFVADLRTKNKKRICL